MSVILLAHHAAFGLPSLKFGPTALLAAAWTSANTNQAFVDLVFRGAGLRQSHQLLEA
jgi:hypothetical protein